MPPMKRSFALLPLLMMMALLASCKTHVAALHQHPSFTFESIKQHAFVVAGVTSSTHQPLATTQRVRYGNLLARSFLEERPYLQVIDAGHLLQKIGRASFTAQLDAFRDTGVMDVGNYAPVLRAFPRARYLMAARIETNHVQRIHEESESDVADSEEDQKKGEYEQVRVDISLRTERNMGVTLSIYDMRLDTLVWSGYVEKSLSHDNHISRIFDKDKRWKEELLNDLVESIIGLNDNTYPAPPTEFDVLREIFRGFAENMPSPVKQRNTTE